MWFLFVLSWISTIVQIIFITLAIAAGLYYLAELVEEYTVMTAKVIRWMSLLTLAIYIGLFLFEEFPYSMIICGIISQILHLLLLNSFPFFNLTSIQFILGVVFVMINHYLAFSHFGEHYYTFSEVMAYFTLCLWLVPFSLFVSLSANENVLPTTSERTRLLSDDHDVVSSYFMNKEKRYGLLAAFNSIKEWLFPARRKRAF